MPLRACIMALMFDATPPHAVRALFRAMLMPCYACRRRRHVISAVLKVASEAQMRSFRRCLRVRRRLSICRR